MSACELLPGCLATTTTQSLSVTVECRSESTKNANLLSLPALALAAVPRKQGELEKRRGARLTTRLLLFLLLLIGPAISALRALVSETGERAIAVAVALAEIEAEPQVAHRVVSEEGVQRKGKNVTKNATVECKARGAVLLNNLGACGRSAHRDSHSRQFRAEFNFSFFFSGTPPSAIVRD